MVSEFLIPMIYEFVIFALTISLTIAIGIRYQRKRNKVIQNMFFFTLTLALANLSAAISRVLRLTGIWEMADGSYLELLSFTVSFIGLSNIFMLMFGIEIFHAKLDPKKKRILILVYTVLTVGYIIFTLFTGLFSRDLTTAIWGILVVLSLAVDIYIIRASFILLHKLDDRTDIFFLRFIAMAPISLIFIYVFFFIDRIMGGDFTVFYYLGWLTVVFATMGLYIGVLRPTFIEEKVTKRFGK